MRLRRVAEPRRILFLALAARAFALLANPPAFPPRWGGEMPAVAWSLAQGHGFGSVFGAASGPTALVPPVYPFLLSGIFRLVGYTTLAGVIATAANALLSALTVLPLRAFALRAFGPLPAAVAAITWALYPLAGFTDAQFVWNTSLAGLLLTTYLALTVSLDAHASRGRWLAYAGVTAVLILNDPVSLAAVIPATIWLLTQAVNRRWVLAAMVLASVPAAAWIARNSAVFGRFVFLRSGLGLELSVGVRDDEFLNDHSSSLPNRNPDELRRYRSIGELAYVHARTAQAVEWITAHPRAFATRVTRRIAGYWLGWRLAGSIYFWYGRFGLLKALLYSLPAFGALASLIIMFRRRWRGFWLYASILAAYPAVYFLTHVLPRYRLPLEPLLFCLTAFALVAISGGAADPDARVSASANAISGEGSATRRGTSSLPPAAR